MRTFGITIKVELIQKVALLGTARIPRKVLKHSRATASNLLCLNSAKSEFLLLDFKPQLNKIHNSTYFLKLKIKFKI